MKKLLLLALVFLGFWTQGQTFGPAQGFPSDPVLSAAFEGDRLYLGTQGSGVYELTEGFIRPSDRFQKFNRTSVYGFSESDTGLVPLLSGELQAYPISVTNSFGTQYIINEGGLQVKYSDAATQISPKPSGIWRMTLGGQRLNFLRLGSELVTIDGQGKELDRRAFKGLLFDLAPTEYGLLLSAESGYYQWDNKAYSWKKVGAGLPIFAFDGAMARTPLGSIRVNKLLEGNWTTEDFSKLSYTRETYENAYDVDSVLDITYAFTANGIEVNRNGQMLYTIDQHRELPNLRPGNYDVALIGDLLYCATPSGMYSFANQGRPNVPHEAEFTAYVDGIETDKFSALTEPTSMAFNARLSVESNAPLLGRYRLNQGEWESWDFTMPILFEYPAPGNYTLEVQADTRADFINNLGATYTFTIQAAWYKRPLFWALVVFFLAAIIVFWQRKERLRANEKLALQERLAEAELQSKRGQMNPHFLFNALDAISNFIFKNQPKDAVLYMGKLAKLMRLTLESSRSTSMVLADEVDLLNKYVDLCILRYGTFIWQLDLDDALDPYDTKLPPMLLQPLIENAVQHAVRPNLAEGKSAEIRVKVSAKDGQLHISIHDNGPGIADIEKASKSHGLAIIRERLELLTVKNGGTHSLELATEENNGSILGTHVSLILPLQSEE